MHRIFFDRFVPTLQQFILGNSFKLKKYNFKLKLITLNIFFLNNEVCLNYYGFKSNINKVKESFPLFINVTYSFF